MNLNSTVRIGKRRSELTKQYSQYPFLLTEPLEDSQNTFKLTELFRTGLIDIL